MYATTLTSVVAVVFATAVVTAVITNEVLFTIVPTVNIPTGAAPVDPIDNLERNINELDVTADVDTVAVPEARVTEPKLFAPADVVVPTLALRILFPDVTKFKLPVTLTFPEPAFKFNAAVVFVVPRVIRFAAAPPPIEIVLTPVEFAILIV